MPAAVVQFFFLGGNQDAARPSIGWVRAKGGETLVFLPPDHPHALIKIIGCFVCTTCPLYDTTLFLHTAYGRNFVVQMVRGTTVLYHHYWWRFFNPLQQLLNNWHSLFSKLIAKYWNMMDDGCHRSLQHDRPTWQGIVSKFGLHWKAELQSRCSREGLENSQTMGFFYTNEDGIVYFLVTARQHF